MVSDSTEFTFTVKPENIDKIIGSKDDGVVEGAYTIMKAALVNIESLAAGMRVAIGEEDIEEDITSMAATFRAIQNVIDDTAANMGIAESPKVEYHARKCQ